MPPARQAFLKGAHRYTFRREESALIIGVFIVRPTGLDERPCYKVQFKDGVIDYIAISEVENGNYEFDMES